MGDLIAEIRALGFEEISKQVAEKTKLKAKLEADVDRMSKEYRELNNEKEINYKELVLAKGEAQSLRVLDHVSILSNQSEWALKPNISICLFRY
jgi:hypothetical protein